MARKGYEAFRAKAAEVYPERACCMPAWDDEAMEARGLYVEFVRAAVDLNPLSDGIVVDNSPPARLAYAAYGAHTDNKNFQGNPMPEWHDLPRKIRQAWCKASSAVVNITASALARR